MKIENLRCLTAHGRGKRIWGLGRGVALLFTVGALVLFGRPLEGKLRGQAFDAVRWRNQKHVEFSTRWTPRLLMVDALLEDRELDGLTREEVIKMLGPPETESAGAVINYGLGLSRVPFPLDWDNLAISFGESGTVDRAWIWQD